MLFFGENTHLSSLGGGVLQKRFHAVRVLDNDVGNSVLLFFGSHSFEDVMVVSIRVGIPSFESVFTGFDGGLSHGFS